jgi:hypothetical protein
VRRHTNLSSASGVIRALWLCVATAAVLLALTASSASAAPAAGTSYVYSSSHAEDGELSPFYSGLPSQLAIQSGTGNMLAPTFAETLVYAPNSAPTDPPIARLEGTNQPPGSVAADPDSGAVYVEIDDIDPGVGRIIRWISNGMTPPTYAIDPSFNPESVTRNIGPMTVEPGSGDLLFAEPESREIIRFGPNGARLSSFPVPLNPELSARAGAIAVGPEIYLLGRFGAGSNTDATIYAIRRYTKGGEALGEIPVEGEPEAIAWNPVTEVLDVSVRRGKTVWLDGYEPDGERVFETPLPERISEAGRPGQPVARGVAVNDEDGTLYLYKSSESSVGIHAFDPVPSPGSERPSVSAVTNTSAIVATSVDPGAGPPAGSFAYFEYSNDGGVTWTPTPSQEVTATERFEVELSGLRPNDNYQVRAVVGNEQARHSTRSIAFATPTEAPLTITGPAVSIKDTNATLTGTVNPVGEQATYHFEYGPTGSYGSRVPVMVDAVAGNGRVPRDVSRVVEGLKPSTAYHYRLVATSPAGTAYGADLTFTTTAASSSVSRAYEQVTPVDKGGSTIDDVLGFTGATNSAISYIVLSPEGGQGSPIFGRAFSVRGADGWNYGGTTDPPIAPHQTAMFISTVAVSSDNTRAFVVSNRNLALGATEGATNLYRYDLGDRSFKFIGSTDARGSFQAFTGIASWNKFLFGSSDFGTLDIYSPYPLLNGVSGPAFYRWTETGGLILESTDEEGVLPAASFVAGPQLAGYLRNVSDNGTRAYYSLNGENEGRNGEPVGVYLRENGVVRPVSVSRRQGGSSQPVAAEFLGTGRDGRFAYLASAEPLTEDGPEGAGGVYRFDADTDQLTYVGAKRNSSYAESFASLGVSDDGRTFYFGTDTGIDVYRDGELREVPDSSVSILGEAQISPDGRYLAMTSFAGQIKLYDYATGTTTCASCKPNGTDPGPAEPINNEHVAGNEVTRYLDDEGDVFFATTAALLPADINGISDVYEYSHEGMLRLVSPGNTAFASHFAAVSADGRDVYFVTAQGLVAQDVDRAPDIYDARVGGGLPGQNRVPEPACEGEACSPPAAGVRAPGANASEAVRGSGQKAKAKPKQQKKKKHRRGKKRKSQCGKHSSRKAPSRCTGKHHRHHKNASQKGGKSR